MKTSFRWPTVTTWGQINGKIEIKKGQTQVRLEGTEHEKAQKTQ